MAQPSPSSATDDTGQGESRLFVLAAELRNRIYELVLVEDEKIWFNKKNFKQPGLLCVNRQIRSEASPIYYHLNTFNVDCMNFDSTSLKLLYRQNKKWVKKSALKESENINFFFQDQQKANWNNVMEWMRDFHAREVFVAPGDVEVCLASGHAITQMLNVVERLRGLPWTKVKYVLECMKHVSELRKMSWK